MGEVSGLELNIVSTRVVGGVFSSLTLFPEVVTLRVQVPKNHRLAYKATIRNPST